MRKKSESINCFKLILIMRMLRRFLLHYSDSYKFRHLKDEHFNLIYDSATCNLYYKMYNYLVGFDI